jgi:hypothetical protein
MRGSWAITAFFDEFQANKNSPGPSARLGLGCFPNTASLQQVCHSFLFGGILPVASHNLPTTELVKHRRRQVAGIR